MKSVSLRRASLLKGLLNVIAFFTVSTKVSPMRNWQTVERKLKDQVTMCGARHNMWLGSVPCAWKVEGSNSTLATT